MHGSARFELRPGWGVGRAGLLGALERAVFVPAKGRLLVLIERRGPREVGHARFVVAPEARTNEAPGPLGNRGLFVRDVVSGRAGSNSC